MSKYKLAKWHNLSERKINNLRLIGLSKKDEKHFLKNLKIIGYCQIKNLSLKNSNRLIIKAFQRRFRQQLINGISDLECFEISKNLIKY